MISVGSTIIFSFVCIISITFIAIRKRKLNTTNKQKAFTNVYKSNINTLYESREPQTSKIYKNTLYESYPPQVLQPSTITESDKSEDDQYMSLELNKHPLSNIESHDYNHLCRPEIL